MHIHIYYLKSVHAYVTTHLDHVVKPVMYTSKYTVLHAVLIHYTLITMR